MKRSSDSQSLTAFKRDTAKIIRQLKTNGEAMVLTVNGKPELIVQDVESYQRLLQRLDRLEAIDGVMRGLDSMKRNVGKPAEQFFHDFFVEKGISERD